MWEDTGIYRCVEYQCMYVEFMKNFLLADSSELLAVRLILASLGKESLIHENISSRVSSELLAVRLISVC